MNPRDRITMISCRRGSGYEGEMKPARCPSVLVAILAGRRPELLRQTLGSFQRSMRICPNTKISTIARLNCRDDESAEILAENEVATLGYGTDAVVPIGKATQDLMFDAARVAKQMGCEVILHLEDDWACAGDPGTWLDHAYQALQDPKIGQVRLRRAVEPVMANNCITARRIHWAPYYQHQIASDAHYTFNPNLVRPDVAEKVFGGSTLRGERGAQEAFGALGLSVVQIKPGAFRHIGDKDSLRTKLHRGHTE